MEVRYSKQQISPSSKRQVRLLIAAGLSISNGNKNRTVMINNYNFTE
jgi:hypothetical protein